MRREMWWAFWIGRMVQVSGLHQLLSRAVCCDAVGIVRHRRDDAKALKGLADAQPGVHRFAAPDLAQPGNELQHLHRGGERGAAGSLEAV